MAEIIARSNLQRMACQMKRAALSNADSKSRVANSPVMAQKDFEEEEGRPPYLHVRKLRPSTSRLGRNIADF